jgi:hypothetical protein
MAVRTYPLCAMIFPSSRHRHLCNYLRVRVLEDPSLALYSVLRSDANVNDLSLMRAV